MRTPFGGVKRNADSATGTFASKRVMVTSRTMPLGSCASNCAREPSDEIKPLYGEPRRVSATRVECDIVNEPRRGTRQLGAYVADLYLPGARKPFLTRKAGRELLAPERVTSVATRTIADGTLDEP
jgi:hypothetical protein